MKHTSCLLVLAVNLIFSLLYTSCFQIRDLQRPYMSFDEITASVDNFETSCLNPYWQYVYNPERLIVIERCKTVTGKVRAIHKAPDGDIHLRIIPDDHIDIKLNFYNHVVCLGSLVAEIVCSHNEKNVKESCLGYSNSLLVPRKGDHVKITGSYVLDTNHGWREIHPISNLELLDR